MSWHFSQSQFVMTFAVDFLLYRSKMETWIKNIDMAKNLTVLSAVKSLGRETKEHPSSVVQMRAVASFKQRRQLAPALSARKNFCRLVQAMKLAQESVERPYACHAGHLTRWSRLGADSLCSAVRSLQGAYGIRPIEQHHFLGIRSKSFGHTLMSISRRACRGTTTGRGVTNGA